MIKNGKIPVLALIIMFFIAPALFSQSTGSKVKVSSTKPVKHRFLVHDEGNAALAYIDEYDPSKNWKYSNEKNTYWGLQLVGNNRVLLGTSNEVDILTGEEVKPRIKTGKNPSAIRLENGNTLLCYEKDSRVIEEVDSTGKVLRKKEFTGMKTLRMATYTPDETFLFGSSTTVDEVDWEGNILWTFEDPTARHICRALRMPNGNTVISTGYGARLLVVSKEKEILKVIGGKKQPGNDSINSNYYAGFHVLPNGNYVLTNWQKHGPGHGDKGVQILEYDSTGALVWSYKNPKMYSSVQDIIILDDLDITKFHDERTGVIAPVEQKVLWRKPEFFNKYGERINVIGNGSGGPASMFTINGRYVGSARQSARSAGIYIGARGGILYAK